MRKIRLHDILQQVGLALLTLTFKRTKAEFLPAILYALREEGIAFSFVSQTIDLNENVILSLAIRQDHEKWVRAALQEGFDLSAPEALAVHPDVALLTLYGPHLGETPGVANRILSALAAGGIEVLAFTASIHSCLLIIPHSSLPKSRPALERIVEIPAS